MSVTTVNLGKIRINWRGAWTTGASYTVNDAVSYGGSSYVCITANTAGSSFSSDSGYWNLMAQGATVNTTAGDITYRDVSQDARLSIGSAGQVLTVGTNGLPQWSNPNASGTVYYVATNGSDANNGLSINTAFASLRKACQTITGPATIYVKAGTYYETLPITVPANVTIIGDGMRDTEITPIIGTASSTYTASGSSGTTLKVASTTSIGVGMTITGTGFVSGQKVTAVVNSTTLTISGAPDVTPSGTLTFRYLSTDASPVANNLSTMFYLSDSTMLQGLLMTGMTGFTPSGGSPTSITAATIGGVYLRLNPATTITSKSPYIKDCTAKSAGGVGAIVDGTAQSGGTTSMVFWAYNIVLDGGVGIWAKDGGKIEAVSVFTYYCYFGYVTSGGGLIRSLSGNNSYGTYGAVSTGYLASETPVTGTVYGGMITYATATGTFQQGETITQAVSNAQGIVTSVQTGYIYYKSTSGTFNTTNLVTGGTSGATTTPTAVGGQNNYVLVLSSLSATPTAGASIQFATGDTSAYVISAVSTATVNSTSVYIITLAQQKVVASNDGVVANIRYNFSLIRLQGHDFLYIGTGGVATTNYPGIPSQSADPAKQITSTFPGRVYYVATDEKGNFNVGQYFAVNQATGSATLNASAFNLSGLTSLRLGSIGAQLGAQVDEFSTDVTLSQNSTTKVPTQSAVTGYLNAAYQNISPAIDTVVTTATASSGNNITVGTTAGMTAGMTAVFGSNMGNLVAQTVYYILTASGTTITVSTVPNGSAFSVGTTTGQSVALNTGYSLGTAGKRWSHVYVGPGSITIGTLTISDNAGALQVQASGANAPANINSIQNGTSNVSVANNGSVTITGGGNLGLTIANDGSATFAGSVTINGGATNLSTTNLNIADALIYMATGNSANLNDIGLVGHFTSGIYQHTGLVRRATDNTWYLFSGMTTEPSTTITISDGTFVLDPLKMGALTATSGTFSGTVAANASGGITTTQTGTVPIFNTNATGLNIGGAATAVSIGASTGTTTINNQLVTGSTIGYVDTGIVATFASTTAGYNQIILQNLSNNAAASTNFNVSNNNGTSTTNFGEFGINSSAFSGSGAFSSAGNVYLAAASTDLAIGTYGSNAIHFVVNSGTTDAATISSTGVFSTTSPAFTTSITTPSTTFSIANSTATTLNIGGAATTVALGATASATTVTLGGGNTGNTLKIAGTTSGTTSLTSDVTTGTINLFASVTTSGTINIGSSGATVYVGGIKPASTGKAIAMSMVFGG